MAMRLPEDILRGLEQLEAQFAEALSMHSALAGGTQAIPAEEDLSKRGPRAIEQLRQRLAEVGVGDGEGEYLSQAAAAILRETRAVEGTVQEVKLEMLRNVLAQTVRGRCCSDNGNNINIHTLSSRPTPSIVIRSRFRPLSSGRMLLPPPHHVVTGRNAGALGRQTPTIGVRSRRAWGKLMRADKGIVQSLLLVVPHHRWPASRPHPQPQREKNRWLILSILSRLSSLSNSNNSSLVQSAQPQRPL